MQPPGEYTYIIVSGTRRATDTHLSTVQTAMLRGVRAAAFGVHYPVCVVQGGAAGVDRLASIVADTVYHWTCHTVKADWDNCAPECPGPQHRRARSNGITYCPGAGPRRNRQMLAQYPTAAVVALPWVEPSGAFNRDLSRGTWDMIEASTNAGRLVIIEPLVIAPEPAPVPVQGILNVVTG